MRNLTIVRIDADNNLILVRGAVPGPNGGLVYLRPTNKKKRKVPPAQAAAAQSKKKK